MNEDVESVHDFDKFTNRSQRSDFLINKFFTQFNEVETILDVGCDQNELKLKLGDKVYGIDVAGNPDRYIDLEKEGLRSLDDRSFDLVVCTEVLEHLDNFHQVLDDICRVSKKYVLISLPNAGNLRKLMHIFKTGNSGKFYGLPLKRPEDRHKWFFTHKEIVNFFNEYSKKNSFKIKILIYHYNLGIFYKDDLFHRMLEKIIYYLVKVFKIKAFCQDVFILFEV